MRWVLWVEIRIDPRRSGAWVAFNSAGEPLACGDVRLASRLRQAAQFKTFEEAETAAFNIIAKQPNLIGKVAIRTVKYREERACVLVPYLT